MLELSNRPRVIKVVSRASGVATNVAQIRKDNFEIQGEVPASLQADERKELAEMVDILRKRQAMFKESILIRLMEVLSEATQRCSETTDEKERQLIRHFIESALRGVRRAERKT